MPANLTPQYQKAEEEYRRAQSLEEQVDGLMRMLQLVPKHKGTEKLQADLKTRLKEARNALEHQAQAGKKTGKSIRFPRQGAGQVVLLGAANAGKSRIVAELTHATPEVAPYPFTTREPMAGMMPWEDVAVQLIDTPPITDSHFEPYLTSLVRSADMALLVMDGACDDAPAQTAEVVRQLAARKTRLACVSGFADDDYSIVLIKTLLAVTHADAPGRDERVGQLQKVLPHEYSVWPVELDRRESRESLRNAIYRGLGVLRVYTKRPGHSAELKDPYTIPDGGTIEDLAAKVHHEMAERLKFAKVWGAQVHDRQNVGRDHRLNDRDVVELHW